MPLASPLARRRWDPRIRTSDGITSANLLAVGHLQAHVAPDLLPREGRRDFFVRAAPSRIAMPGPIQLGLTV
jgi:hypothetical protein